MPLVPRCRCSHSTSLSSVISGLGERAANGTALWKYANAFQDRAGDEAGRSGAPVVAFALLRFDELEISHAWADNGTVFRKRANTIHVCASCEDRARMGEGGCSGAPIVAFVLRRFDQFELNHARPRRSRRLVRRGVLRRTCGPWLGGRGFPVLLLPRAVRGCS